jgi:hypothetical protein
VKIHFAVAHTCDESLVQFFSRLPSLLFKTHLTIVLSVIIAINLYDIQNDTSISPFIYIEKSDKVLFFLF